MSGFLKYLYPIAGVLAMVMSAFSGNIQNLISAHPALGGVFAGLAALIGSFMPQPQKPTPPAA